MLTDETLRTLVGQIVALEPQRNVENRDKAVRILRNAIAEQVVAEPKISDASITACALMIKGIVNTRPQLTWLDDIEKRIRRMLAGKGE
jgi:hypothetical protein